MPSTTKTQKKPISKPKRALKKPTRRVAVKKSARKVRKVTRKPKLAQMTPVEDTIDPALVSEHLASLRSLSDLPPINLDDLIRGEQPYQLATVAETVDSDAGQGVSLRSRISFYLGVFFGAVVVHVLVVVFLTMVSV